MMRPPQQAPPMARATLPSGKPSKGALPGPPGPMPGQLQRAGSINMSAFASLLNEHKVDTGDVPVKEAYQFFKRIESQRQRKALDASPATVLSLMKDQLMLLHHRRTDSFRSTASSSTRSIIPPPPSRSPSTSSLAPSLLNRQDSQGLGLQRSPSAASIMGRGSQGGPPPPRRANRQDSDSNMVLDEVRAGLDQAKQLMSGLQDAPAGSPQPRGRTGRKQLPPPPQLPPSHDPPGNSAAAGQLARRYSESQVGASQREKAPGFHVERHSLSHSPIRKKPPPPSVPPPALRRQGSQASTPAPSLLPPARQNSFMKPPPPSVNSFMSNVAAKAKRVTQDAQRRLLSDGAQRGSSFANNGDDDDSEDEEQSGLLDLHQQQQQEQQQQPHDGQPSQPKAVSFEQPASSQQTTQFTQQTQQHSATERDMFKLREKLTALENQVAREQKDKDRLREHLLQAQRELHMSQTNLKEAEDTLGAVRERVASNEKIIAEQKEKIKAVQLDQKVGARKSRQRFDAAIDFMKGLLVDTKFETLVQTLKSRLRMIVGAERAEIYVVDHQREELIAYRERTGARRPLPNGSNLWMGRFPMDVGIVGSVIQEKTMQVVQEVESDVRFDALVDGIGSNGVRSLVVYPILMRQEVVATVVVVNKLSANGRIAGDAFSTQDINAVQDFATLTTLVFLQQQIGKTRSASTASLRQLNASASDAEEESDDDEDDDDAKHKRVESKFAGRR